MNEFALILKELMEDFAITPLELSQKIGIKNVSTIQKCLRGENNVSLKKAIEIANVFNCSLDYLYGRSVDMGNCDFKDCPPWNEQFRKVLKEQNVSTYRLLKDNILNVGNIHLWSKENSNAHMTAIVRLADYLDVSLDYLVGREK